MPTPTSTVTAATALMAIALLLTGCSSSEPYESSAPAAAPPVATRGAGRRGEDRGCAAAAATPARRQRAPACPGSWHCGQDNRTDYTFIVASAGEYELDHKETPALPAFVEKGWIAGHAQPHPAASGAGRRGSDAGTLATWSKLPNSVGINILVVSDLLFGELTYVPADR